MYLHPKCRETRLSSSMNTFTSHIALLVFNQSPYQEALRKSSKAREVALRVFSQAKTQVIRYGQACQLEVFDSAAWEISGADFAQNLRQAVGKVLEKGFTHVLVVGIDTPGLCQHHIAEAKATLENGQSPVGPDLRGGAYLLTFDAPLWNSTIWESCRWGTSDFLQDWTEFSQTHALSTLADIQTGIDFDWVKTILRFRWMLKALEQQILVDCSISQPIPIPKLSPSGLRAPPK